MSGRAIPPSASNHRRRESDKYVASEASTNVVSDDRSLTATTVSQTNPSQSGSNTNSSSSGRTEQKRQSRPVLEPIPSQKPPSIRRRSSPPPPTQEHKPVTRKRLAKNYRHFVRDFNLLKKYAKQNDGTFSSTTLCALCETARPRLVFYPCQHRCVCDRCLLLNDITCEPTSASSCTACPVCMADIKLMLPPTAEGEALYWKWALEVQPTLPFHFKDEFKDAGKRLRRGSSAVQPVNSAVEQPATAAAIPSPPPDSRPSQPKFRKEISLADSITSKARRISQHSLRTFSLASRRGSIAGGANGKSGTATISESESSKCTIL